MPGRPPQPPALAAWLAHRLGGGAHWRDVTTGDLLEEFHLLAMRDGTGRARRWYRRQVLGLAADACGRSASRAAASLASVIRPQGDPPMRSLFQEARQALRSLLHQKLTTATVILTLAIGLGANAAVFGMADSLLLRPFTFEDVDRLVVFSEDTSDFPFPQETVAPGNFVEWPGLARSFTGMAAMTQSDYNFAGGEQSDRIEGAEVSGEFFQLLQMTPALGRLLDPSDDVRGQHRQAVLGHGLWQRRFGGDPNVLGGTVRLDGEPFTVVGVAPEGFEFPAGARIWTPLALSDESRANRRSQYLTVFARLTPDVTFDEASAEMASIYQRQKSEHAADLEDRRLVTYTFSAGMVDGGLPRILVLWQAAALVVLLIGCTNVANLLLARGATRGRELAVRAAIGASRWRLVRQLLVESFVLAMAATPAALVVAAICFGLIRDAMPEELLRYLPGWTGMGVDLRVGLVTLAAASVTAVVFGLLPAWQASRPGLTGALREGGRSASASSRGWLRRGLVVAELALALPLLIASGMAALGAQQLASGPQGYEPEGVLRMRLMLPSADYPDAGARRLLARQVLDEARGLPGVEMAATASTLPSSTYNQRRSLAIDGRAQDPDRLPSVNWRAVSPDYHRLMRIPLLQGRPLEATDLEGTEPVAVISQSMARRFWPEAPSLGARVRLGGADSPLTTIVGISGDTIDDWFAYRDEPTVYVPVEQAPTSVVALVLRSQADPVALAEDVRRAVARIDPALAPYDVATMPDAIRIRTTGIRFIGGIMAAFGVIALVLAAIGIYSVMAYFVTQRRQEIGIRMALGASAREVLTRTVGRGARMAALGIAIGLGLGLLLGRLMESALFGVVSLEPWLFAAIAGILGTVALLATIIPARAASRVNPISVLREG